MEWKDGRAVAVVATGAIIFGFVGLPIRVLNDLGMGAMEIAMVRLGITTIGIAVIALLTDRSALRMDSAKDLVLLVMVGVSKFLTDIACLNAQISIELSLATLLQMTAPCYVMVFSRLLFGEGITVPRIVAVAVAFVGCVLVTGVLTGDIDNMDIFGLVCGILSGLFFSLYLVGCKVCSNHGHSTTTVIFYVFLVASLLTIPFTDLSCVGKMMMNADSIPYILLMVRGKAVAERGHDTGDARTGHSLHRRIRVLRRGPFDDEHTRDVPDHGLRDGDRYHTEGRGRIRVIGTGPPIGIVTESQ